MRVRSYSLQWLVMLSLAVIACGDDDSPSSDGQDAEDISGEQVTGEEDTGEEDTGGEDTTDNGGQAFDAGADSADAASETAGGDSGAGSGTAAEDARVPAVDGGAVGADTDGDPTIDFPTGPTLELHSLQIGDFELLAGYSGVADPDAVGGQAMLSRMVDGTTMVQIQVHGVSPDTDYPVHVHAGPCSASGLGHYLIDPAVEGTIESNEIWPAFTSDDDGNGYAEVTADHSARGDALSVVVHDPARENEKILCADLLLSDEQGERNGTAVASEGTFAPFAAAEAIDMTISGEVQMVRRATTTVVTVDLIGLDPSGEYRSHVHEFPCDVSEAEGHYLIDPTIEETIESNEIWPLSGSPNEDGELISGASISDHFAREDAQSVVIHRVDGDAAPKVACADLVRVTEFPSAVTQGVGSLVEEGTARLPNLSASATMHRHLDLSTQVELNIEGATADFPFAIRVHDRPCWLGNGGGHYIQDLSQAPSEENEIWLDGAADQRGVYSSSVTVQHLARPDAQSIVIHDAADNARLMCLDLD